MTKTAVVALGGNAITRPGQEGTYAQQTDRPPVGPAELLPQEREIALALTAAPPAVMWALVFQVGGGSR